VAICLGTAAKPDSNNSADSGVFVIFLSQNQNPVSQESKAGRRIFPIRPFGKFFQSVFIFLVQCCIQQLF
jgi:hypothetical protein